MKLLILVSSLILTVFSFAQKTESGSIKGIVTTADGQPAEYVTVLVKNTRIGTITDENGNFEIRKLKSGKYILVFSLSGNAENEIPVEVKHSEQSFLKIQIQQTYTELQKVIVAAKLSSKYAETRPSPSLRLNYPLIEMAQNIQTTSNQLLTDQGLISMSEAIRTVSGIQKNYGELNDVSLNIRGFDATWGMLRNGIGGTSRKILQWWRKLNL